MQFNIVYNTNKVVKFMSIGERLKSLRLEAGLTQKEVAESLRMSKPIVSQYESNQRTPSLEKLIRFSRFYNASLDYICENVDEKNAYYGDTKQQ